MAFVKSLSALALAAFVFLASGPANAGLLGTQLSVQVVFQQSLASEPIALGFQTSALVVDPGLEFPDLALTMQAGAVNRPIVPISIDAGDDFLDFQVLPRAGSGNFATAFFNGYQFTFDAAALPSLVSFTIDPRTTLGIIADDVMLNGNMLRVNVSALPFNSASRIRLNLQVRGGPGGTVPEPNTTWMIPLALVLAMLCRRSELTSRL